LGLIKGRAQRFGPRGFGFEARIEHI